MSSYNELIALINGCINRNGVQAITGRVLNGVLRAMVNQLGAGYAMGGVAHPTDDPGTPEAPVCYYASEVGTYTHFGNIQIVPGELALLCFDLTDGWFKETMYEGFESVQATIDGNVGTPAVNVTYVNGVLSFDFSNMKGNTGAAAGFGNVTAAVDGTSGTPGVSVQTDGPDTAKNIAFQFTGLKGETGVTSVIATVDNTSGTPQCAVSLNGQQLTLAFTGLKGAQGDTGSSVAYPFTIVNNLTTNDPTQALSAAMGVQLEAEVSQLEAKIDGRTTLVATNANTVDGWQLDGDGKCSQNSNARLKKYPVSEGSLLYLELSNNTLGVCQFQNSSSVPASLPNSGLIGTPVSNAVSGFMEVPTGASWLIVSQLKTNTSNLVQVSDPENEIDPLKFGLEKLQDIEPRVVQLESDVDAIEDTIHGGEEITIKTLTLQSVGIAMNNAFLDYNSKKPVGTTNCVISNPIYLAEGDEIDCQTGGTGIALVFKLSNGAPIVPSTVASEVVKRADINGISKYKHTIEESEAGWYGFSGRSNRNDGTNLVLTIKKFVADTGLIGELDGKVGKDEMVGNFGLISQSVGPDLVKDEIPDSPWFDPVANDGMTYGNYLDDKLDSVPAGKSFIFITDVHYPGNRKKSAALIDYARRRLGIKTVISGGDVINEAVTIAAAAEQWMGFERDFVFRMGGDVKQTMGDHDSNGGAGHTPLPYEFLQKMLTGYNAKELVFDDLYDEEVSTLNWSESDMSQYEAWKRMHYYFDDLTIRTRFIVLHTGWGGESGLAVDKLGEGALNETNALYLQMDFVYNALMTTPEGFDVVVVGHNTIGNTLASTSPIRYNLNNVTYKGSWKQVNEQLAACKSKSFTNLLYRSWSMPATDYKSFEFFTAPNIGNVLCIGGDVHWDILAKVAETDGTITPVNSGDTISKNAYIINSVTMTDGSDREYYDQNGDPILPPATPDTIDSQAFDIITIAKKGIFFTRVGCGNDRSIYFSD